MTRRQTRTLVGLLSVIALLAIAVCDRAEADTYTYDVFGRLTSVTYTDGSSITYTYDAAGNRVVLSQAATP